jgi:hypothetical protein
MIRRAVTPRGTDWSLALLVALGVVTGLATWFAGSPQSAWVFSAHAVLGVSLAIVLVWKLRRVWARIVAPRRWDARTGAGLGALGLVALALGSGLLWSSGLDAAFGGMTLLGWHVLLGALLGVMVLSHARASARGARGPSTSSAGASCSWARPWAPARSPRGRSSARRSDSSGCAARGVASRAPTTRARSRRTSSP